MDKAKIDRINELARKNKTVGLTDEELAERAALREEYLESFRIGARATLESVRIQEEDGTLTPLKKRAPGEAAKILHHHHHDHCCDHHDHHDHHHHDHCCDHHDHHHHED